MSKSYRRRRRHAGGALLHNFTPRRRAWTAAIAAACFFCLAGVLRLSVARADFGTKCTLLFALLLGALAGVTAAGGGKSRRARVFRGLSHLGEALLFLFIACFAAVQMLVTAGAHTDPPPSDTGADYLVVMGAGLRGSTPTPTLVTRLDAAYDYLCTYPECRAVLSGGQGETEDIPEAEAMRDYLMRLGVSADRLILEPRAHSTVENVRYSMALMDARGGGYTVAAVSNGFHLYRIRQLFWAAGIEVQAVGAPMPNAGSDVSLHIREFFSIVNMWLGNPLSYEVL